MRSFREETPVTVLDCLSGVADCSAAKKLLADYRHADGNNVYKEMQTPACPLTKLI
jgi:hypothetical protein